jgi:hypothetical protein
MRRSALISIALFLLGGFSMAQAPVPAGASVTSRSPLGWEAAQRLKPGTKVAVRQPLTPGEFEPRRSCKVVHVDATSLTCTSDGQQGQRVVYPVAQIDSVYQFKLHFPWIRTVVYAGIGSFVGGGVLTGGNWDHRLGTAGAIVGGLNAVIADPPGTKLVLVYRRVQRPAIPSTESLLDELDGISICK